MGIRESRDATEFKEATELFKKGSYHPAQEILDRVIVLEPDNVDALFMSGVCNFRLRRLDRAEEQFRSVISANNRHYWAHYYIGLLLERKNRLDDALIEYQCSLSIYPNFKEAIEKVTSLKGTAPHTSTTAPASTTVQKERVSPITEKERLTAGDPIYEGHRRIRSYSFRCIFWFLIPLFLLWFPNMFFDSRATRYKIYERRIDFRSGILSRKEVSLWVYQIEDVWLTRTPFNLLTSDATLHLRASGLESSSGKSPLSGNFEITGLGNYKFMKELFEEVRDAALVERRALKNWWV